MHIYVHQSIGESASKNPYNAQKQLISQRIFGTEKYFYAMRTDDAA